MVHFLLNVFGLELAITENVIQILRVIAEFFSLRVLDLISTLFLLLAGLFFLLNLWGIESNLGLLQLLSFHLVLAHAELLGGGLTIEKADVLNAAVVINDFLLEDAHTLV